jgi:hypothetical protein
MFWISHGVRDRCFFLCNLCAYFQGSGRTRALISYRTQPRIRRNFTHHDIFVVHSFGSFTLPHFPSLWNFCENRAHRTAGVGYHRGARTEGYGIAVHPFIILT